MAEDKLIVTPIDPDGVRIRSGPGPEYEVVTTASIGDALTVIDDATESAAKIGQKNEWLYVETRSGLKGFVAAWFVNRAYASTKGEAPPEPPPSSEQPEPPPEVEVVPPDPTAEPLTVRTTEADGLNVRTGPSTDYERLGGLTRSDHVDTVNPADARVKLGQQNQWFEIVMPDGQRGWVAAWYMEEAPEVISFEHGHALTGLHGPANAAGWAWDETVYSIIREARIEAVKFLTGPDVGKEQVDRLNGMGIKFMMTRIFYQFPDPRTPEFFVNEAAQYAKNLYDAGVRYFEVHNEPNLHHAHGPEGMWVNWQNGAEFGEFLLKSIELFRQHMPDAKFGWPGLSPGLDINGPDGKPLRYNDERFQREADFAMQAVDFICMHTYWGADGSPYTRSLDDIRAYAERFPDKPIFATEFSNSSPNIDKHTKGLEYQKFYNEAKNLPPNVGGLFSFVCSATGGFPHETWKDSPIPQLVGQR